MYRYQTLAAKKPFKLLAGVDEAGRGPIAGPVVSAAVILPEKYLLEGINDSKKLMPKMRSKIYDQLMNDKNVCIGVGISSVELIDQINILQATVQSMIQAIDNLSIKPDFILIDGLCIPKLKIPNQKVIKGDGTCLSIAAASIIAKEHRDRIMMCYDKEYSAYGFRRHKGYCTKFHIEMVKKYGPCAIHRKSFSPIKYMVEDYPLWSIN